jgi:hypothetical protein
MTADCGAAHQPVIADIFEIYLAWSDTTLTVRPGQPLARRRSRTGLVAHSRHPAGFLPPIPR